MERPLMSLFAVGQANGPGAAVDGKLLLLYGLHG